MTEIVAGSDLDAEIAEKVMGYTVRRGVARYDDRPMPWMVWDTPNGTINPISYSTDIAAAWLVVEVIQQKNPGWRFLLLGGDLSYGYKNNLVGLGVDPSKRLPFGWRAEFFGHIDPSLDTGTRHASEWAETPALAICKAALATQGERV